MGLAELWFEFDKVTIKALRSNAFLLFVTTWLHLLVDKKTSTLTHCWTSWYFLGSETNTNSICTFTSSLLFMACEPSSWDAISLGGGLCLVSKDSSSSLRDWACARDLTTDIRTLKWNNHRALINRQVLKGLSHVILSYFGRVQNYFLNCRKPENSS